MADAPQKSICVPHLRLFGVGLAGCDAPLLLIENYELILLLVAAASADVAVVIA